MSFTRKNRCDQSAKPYLGVRRTVLKHDYVPEIGAGSILSARPSIGTLLRDSVRLATKTTQSWSLFWIAFQWCIIAGEWDLSIAMLEQCAILKPDFIPYFDRYCGCAFAEVQRANVFKGATDEPSTYPGSLPGTQDLIKERLALMHAINRSRPVPPLSVPDNVVIKPSEIPGATNLGKFAWLIDSDSRLGQICEIFLGGRYFWIPFDIICEVNLAPVMSLVDRVWRQVIVRLRSGESYAGLLPARYVGTQFADDDLKLGQTTLWIQLGGALQAGLGERQFRCDRGAQWRISRLTVIRFDANAGGRNDSNLPH